MFSRQVSIVLAVTLAAAAVVSADGGYGHPAPAYTPDYYCRDTNTSIYAEVCVPAFADRVTPVTLATKNIVDGEYCFDETLTVCEETSTTVDRELCTFEYVREDVVAPCTTTQVTFEEKSETMKKTNCRATGYGNPNYGAGEHQVCREEYQTQAYRVPLVTVPKTEECKLAYPAPKQVCVTKSIVITEVKCSDKVARKCLSVAKWEDSSVVINQKDVVIGEPSCQQLTLTLPPQACTKNNAYKKPY